MTRKHNRQIYSTHVARERELNKSMGAILFLWIFKREVTLGHEIKSEIGRARYWPGVIINELGHGGLQDRKRGWIVQKWQSNLVFDLVTHRDLALEE